MQDAEWKMQGQYRPVVFDNLEGRRLASLCMGSVTKRGGLGLLLFQLGRLTSTGYGYPGRGYRIIRRVRIPSLQ